MKRIVAAVVAVALVAGTPNFPPAQRSRGSVSHSAGSTTAQAPTADLPPATFRNQQRLQRQQDRDDAKWGSKSVNKDINTQDQSVNRTSTATNAWGQSASRDRTTTNEGGYGSVQGSASTSTGRYASGSGSVGRDAYGQPAYAGTVNTKYNGSYATAGARNPYGGRTRQRPDPTAGR